MFGVAGPESMKAMISEIPGKSRAELEREVVTIRKEAARDQQIWEKYPFDRASGQSQTPQEASRNAIFHRGTRR